MRGVLFHGASGGVHRARLLQRHQRQPCRCNGRTSRMRGAGGARRHIRTLRHGRRSKRDGFGVLRSATGCGAFGLPWRDSTRNGSVTQDKGAPSPEPHSTWLHRRNGLVLGRIEISPTQLCDVRHASLIDDFAYSGSKTQLSLFWLLGGFRSHLTLGTSNPRSFLVFTCHL